MEIRQLRSDSAGPAVSGKKMKMMPDSIKVETLFQDVLDERLKPEAPGGSPASTAQAGSRGNGKAVDREKDGPEDEAAEEKPAEADGQAAVQNALLAAASLIKPVIIDERDMEADPGITALKADAHDRAAMPETAGIPETAAMPETAESIAASEPAAGTESPAGAGEPAAQASAQAPQHSETVPARVIAAPGDDTAQSQVPAPVRIPAAPAQGSGEIPGGELLPEPPQPLTDPGDVEPAPEERANIPEEADIPEETDPFEEMVNRASRRLADARSQRQERQTAALYTRRQESAGTSYANGPRRIEGESGTGPHQVLNRSRGSGQETEPPAILNAAEPSVIRAPETPVRQEKAERPADTPTQAEQINTEIVRNLENRKMEFRMQLQPEELGRIDIKMALEGGKLMIEIAASAKTSELLNRQIDNLVASVRYGSPELTDLQVVTATAENGTAYLDSAMNNPAGQDAGQGQAENGGTGRSGGAGRQSPQEMAREAGQQRPVDPSRLMDYAV